MRVSLFISIALLCSSQCFSQKIDKIINAEEVGRIEKILSADDMQGRKTFTPGIDKAADFIAAEFAKSKLGFWGDNKNYFQEITMIKAKPLEISGTLDGETLNGSNVAANSTMADLHIVSLQDYEVVVVKKEDDFNKTVFPLLEKEKNLLILFDTAHAGRFARMKRFAGNAKFASAVSQLLF